MVGWFLCVSHFDGGAETEDIRKKILKNKIGSHTDETTEGWENV
jgi:hypothetical protein